MHTAEVQRGVTAATSIATSLDLSVDETVVLNNSNKLTLRLRPCDVVARVAPAASQVAQFEIDLARRLAAEGSPVVALAPRIDPQVYDRDSFVVTLWTYYDSTASQQIPPRDYALALRQLHLGMGQLDVHAPRFTERVEEARELLARRDQTPELPETDRELLVHTLQAATGSIAEGGTPEQLLHGEPHPGNILRTRTGLLFLDFETCCLGPVEFDLAHAPEEVAEHYPAVDRALLSVCRMLVLAMITTWRWDRDDQLPEGHRLRTEWLSQLRAALRR